MLAQRWMDEQRKQGRSEEEMMRTMFVYEDAVMEIITDEHGEMQIEAQKPEQLVIFRSPEERKDPGHICRCCTMEHDNEKEAMQCCAFIDD